MNFQDYLTAADAAKLLDRTPARVRKLCTDGKLAGAIKPARDWLVPRASVVARKRARPRTINKEKTK